MAQSECTARGAPKSRPALGGCRAALFEDVAWSVATMAHQDTSNAERIARRLCTFADAVRDSGLPRGDFSADTAEADRLLMEI